MEFFETFASDGLRIVGLVSRANRPIFKVIHVHGYGGDFFSNRFVRVFHEVLPRHGVTFASFGLRTMSYLTEVYSESTVRYVGSAVENPDDAALDLAAVTSQFASEGGELVIQGHSFGTNIVKRFARTANINARVVLLSPADSMALFDSWRLSRSLAKDSDEPVRGSDDIRWDLFGLRVGEIAYPLPISQSTLGVVVNSQTFHEWDQETPATLVPALVVRGKADPISNFGTTADLAQLGLLLPTLTSVTIPGSGHGFESYEHRLVKEVTEWLFGS